MVGHVVQHLVELKAHAAVFLPDVTPYWFLPEQGATARSIEVAPVAVAGCFRWPIPDDGLRSWRYPRWGMVAYEVEFRNME